MARVFRCSDCRCNLTKTVDAPMLRDEVWATLAKPNEPLCYNCFYERALDREVLIYLAQLKPCVLNLFHTPRSFFDLFLEHEQMPPSSELIEEWQAAIDEAATFITT